MYSSIEINSHVDRERISRIIFSRKKKFVKTMQNSQFKEINRETLRETKWISFKTITYTDKNGVERKWDMCERATTTGAVDAVDVLALFKKKGEEDKIVIELQYR